MWNKIKQLLSIPLIIVVSVVGGLGLASLSYSAISQITGVAGKNGLLWIDTVDGSAGDTLTRGVLGTAGYIFNGTTFDRVRGVGGAINVNTTGGTAGTGFFAVDRANITTASVNIAFGLTSTKVMIRAPSTNTDDICIDYLGGTAACPAANTAGNDRLKPGTSILMDGYSATSFSVIAGSGTQEVQVTAWN